MLKFSMAVPEDFPAKNQIQTRAAVYRDAKVRSILALEQKPSDALAMIRGVYV